MLQPETLYDNIKERIIAYQHDIICCYDAGIREDSDFNRIKQDKAIIEELTKILDGENPRESELVFIG